MQESQPLKNQKETILCKEDSKFRDTNGKELGIFKHKGDYLGWREGNEESVTRVAEIG